MTREEEIERASKIRADQYSHPVDWNECYYHFKEGAEWADRTMIDKACGYLSKLTKFVCCSEGGGVEQPVFTDAEIELFKHKMMEE